MPELILTCKNSYDILVHLVALDNGINPDIAKLKKYRGDIFSEWYTESFKETFLRYVNEVLFKMVKTSWKGTYLGGTTPTALKNKVSTCWQMNYDRATCVMVNQLVNEFYTRFLFKIVTLPQDFDFLLDIAATFFNNLSPDVR